jgi:hypothetical protein
LADSQLSANTVTLNQWYRIDMLADRTGTTWTLDWQVDGVTQTQATKSGQVAGQAWSRFDLYGGDSADAHGNSFDHDDVIVSVTSGDYPLGEVQVIGITADQSAAATHSGIVTTEVQYTDDFSAFTDFASATETDSRSRLDDLNTSDGIQLKGADTSTAPTWVSSTAQSSGTATTSGSVTLPATAANDILILTIVNGGATTAPTTVGAGTYTGGAWTNIDAGGGGTFASGWGGVYWSRATGNHSGQTVTWSGATDSTSGIVTVVRGAATGGNPIDTNIAAASVAATNGSLTGFNTTVAITLVLFCAMTDDNQTKSGFTMNAVAMSNLTLAVSSGGADSGVGVATATRAAAGATGNFALTEAAGTASGKRLTAFAIKPAVISGGGALTGFVQWPVGSPSPDPGTAPLGIALVYDYRTGTAVNGNLTVQTELSGSTLTNLNGTVNSTTWQYPRSVMATKPGGGAWTRADVDGIQFRLDSTGTGTGFVWIGGFVFEVAFTPAVGKADPVEPFYMRRLHLHGR